LIQDKISPKIGVINDKNDAAQNKSQSMEDSLQNLLLKVSENKNVGLKMQVGSEDYLLDGIRKEFCDAITDHFFKIPSIVQKWIGPQRMLTRQKQYEDKQNGAASSQWNPNGDCGPSVANSTTLDFLPLAVQDATDGSPDAKFVQPSSIRDSNDIYGETSTNSTKIVDFDIPDNSNAVETLKSSKPPTLLTTPSSNSKRTNKTVAISLFESSNEKNATLPQKLHEIENSGNQLKHSEHQLIDFKVCINCNEKLLTSAKFCSECGVKQP
jgi:ribosomal protein L40E